MRAMILAAGLGTRMGELTRKTPKALLRIGDHYLIEHSLMQLVKAGIQDIVINLFFHGEQIEKALGNGKRYGATILYSKENERLETGGGIFKALPLLGPDPFLVISCDIITDFPFYKLDSLSNHHLAHLIMVDNPVYHPEGDFALTHDEINLDQSPKLTYANIGLFHPSLFNSCRPGHFRLTTVLQPAIKKKLVSGEYYAGKWHNIGTPEDMANVK